MKETDWNQMTVVDKLLKELKRHCYRSQQVFVRRSRAYTNSSIYIFIINKIYRSFQMEPSFA